MVSEPLIVSLFQNKMSSSSSIPKEEPELNLQTFHQCSSLISIKLSNYNFTLWRSEMIPLVRGLGLSHHLVTNDKPDMENMDAKGIRTPIPKYESWSTNDSLLTSWLLGSMKEGVISFLFEEANTGYEVWTSQRTKASPFSTVDKEGNLKHMLMNVRKGIRIVTEYLRDF